jgi:phosphoribosylformylglycinamidine synthase
MDGYIIVGGFSYEDRSRAGIIAALDPVMKEIQIQSEMGKPVLGICNGAQILVETGMVPGLKNNQSCMALTENRRILDGKILGTGFYNSWIYMCPSINSKDNAFTRHLSEATVLSVPIAHAEGRFVMPVELLQEINNEGLNVFQYCDAEGRILDNFPINPNGSLLNTAAIMNKSGNVMAMMPHPERTSAGDPIFLSMRDYILERKEFNCSQLAYQPEPITTSLYQKRASSFELLVKLVITDNHALTVQNTLKQLGITVRVSRAAYWNIECDPESIDKIKQTGVLYNERKEYLVAHEEVSNASTLSCLVIPKDDLLGLQKKQMLLDHFSIGGIEEIHHGMLWMFESDAEKIADIKELILNTHIIFNPSAHDYYEY